MKKLSLLLILLLVACAVPPKQESPEIIRQNLQAELDSLPGAVIATDGLLISYPDENLFSIGAVLPLPGGMEVLDPLILLLQNSQFKGVGTVRSAGHSAEYDLQLAMQRLEMLSRIFSNRGLTEDRFQLTVEAGPGAPFELKLQPTSPDNSVGEKQ